MPADTPTIIPADRAYRRQVLLVVLPLALLCTAGLLALLGRFRELASLAEVDAAAALAGLRRLVGAVSAGNAGVSLALCAWLGRLCYRTYTCERYPPPGVRVLRDTRLRTGRDARRMAAAQVAAMLLVLSTNAVMWHLRRIVLGLQG